MIIVPTGAAWDGRSPLPITLVVDVTADKRFPIRLVATPLLALGVPTGATIRAEGTATIPLRLPLTLGH